MIREEKVYKCPNCQSINIVKNGTYNKKQKYKCNDCKSFGTLNPMPKYSEEQKEIIIKAYQERSSIRGIKRTFGVSIPTLLSWLKKTTVVKLTPEKSKALLKS